MSNLSELIELCDDSSDSVVELEKPLKPPPPLIELADNEELILNVSEAKKELIHHPVVFKGAVEYNPLADCISADHWTPSMRLYYNGDWGNEATFEVDKLQQKMSKAPKLWDISIKLKRKNRCRKCGGAGHAIFQCKERVKDPVCHMCGNNGHCDSNCPFRMCLKCGRGSEDFQYSCHSCNERRNIKCHRCQSEGHTSRECNDLWRRFHSTTSTMNVTKPQNSVNRPTEELWCCNCGCKGHESYFCSQRRGMGVFKAYPYVSSYDALSFPQGRRNFGPQRYFQNPLRNHENGHSSGHSFEMNNGYRSNNNVRVHDEIRRPSMNNLFVGHERNVQSFYHTNNNARTKQRKPQEKTNKKKRKRFKIGKKDRDNMRNFPYNKGNRI